MQDATKVALGGHGSNVGDFDQYASDPASFPAGSVVSLASTGLLSLLKSAGMRIGVSRGKSLADHKKTSVQRAGLRVPVLASLKRASAVVTISSYANLVSGTDDTLQVGATTFTAQAGAATPGDATFQAASSNASTATSLAAQINAHATASTEVYAVASGDTVTLYAVADGEAGNAIDLVYTDNDTNVGITLTGNDDDVLNGGSDDVDDIAYVTVGAKMYINDVTGKADIAMSGFSTVSDAVYVAAPKTGIAEDGSEVAAVIVDMQGGL